MGKEISLFSGYNVSENRTTNYCLLMLKSLYDENPRFLGELLSSLISEDTGDLVGVRFRQQEKKKESIPDGLISQRAFTVYVETKNRDWFYDDQLEKHLDALDREALGKKILIALGNFDATNEEREQRFSKIISVCNTTYKQSIFFIAITFEELIDEIESLQGLSKNLFDMIAEFRRYLSEQGLLSSWKNLLDVVNCSGSFQEVVDGNVYFCPALGGHYSHLRCKYFGAYRNKKVERVALVEGVVDLESQEIAIVRWKNSGESNSDLIQKAVRKQNQFRKGIYPTRIFLLGPLIETQFIKSTSGGLFGSKRYFDISHLDAKNDRDLAQKLNGKNWPVNTWVVT